MTLPAAPRHGLEFGHDALVVCDNVVRIYQTETVEVQALQGLDLLVHEGELIALVGASGSGKSTLLNVLAGTDAPTAGRARVAGHDLTDLSRAEQVHYRRHVVGFVRQQAALNLVPYLSARQVVDLPMTIAGMPRAERPQRVDELLELLGVGHCADRRPPEMSGGEQQRVSIAVAVLVDCVVVGLRPGPLRLLRRTLEGRRHLVLGRHGCLLTSAVSPEPYPGRPRPQRLSAC